MLVGLIVLIFEVRQNADLTRASIETDKNDVYVEIEMNLSSPENAAVWVKSIMQPQDLTLAEARRVESFLASALLQWDYMFQMERAGLISRDNVIIHIKDGAPVFFGSHFGKLWFERELPHWEGTMMEEVAAPIVRSLSPTLLLDSQADMMVVLAQAGRELSARQGNAGPGEP